MMVQSVEEIMQHNLNSADAGAQPTAALREPLLCSQTPLTQRPICDDDRDFLLFLYASTRTMEKALLGWDDQQWDEFMVMQFHLQHTQYLQNYGNATFDVILVDGLAAGRLYVDRGVEYFRIIDIALLPEFRGRGLGGKLIKALIREAEAQGVPVTLHVEKFNPALQLYRRLGFCIVADREVSWFMMYPATEAATEE